jgi:hypothetical protein
MQRKRLQLCALVVLCAEFAIGALSTKGARGASVPGPGDAGSSKAGLQSTRLDPAAWGDDHVGKPTPDFVHGDECLFCHRNNIGATWQKNAHGIAVRQSEDAPELRELLRGQASLASVAPQIQFFLGSRHRVRFLKKEGYGKFAILSTQAVLGADRRAPSWVESEKPAWDKDKFANRCAGCHATAVDPKTRAFAGFGLDCYTCHGNVDLDHTGNTSLVWLSKKSRKDPKAVISTCAQCHIRLAKSRSTGLPYPNNFVAGDNLFKDYLVDFSKADDPGLNPGDRHILRNIRDVVQLGAEAPTCTSCHQVHENSSLKHHRAPKSAICADCHGSDDYKILRPYSVKSDLCEY